MKIRVPLDQAEIIKVETVLKIEELMAERTKIKHTASAENKIQAIIFTMEALALLYEPVANLIKRSQNFKIEDQDRLKELVKIHVGRRFRQKVTDAYELEAGDSLWDLYNAMTFVATHNEDLQTNTRERLLDKASKILVEAV